MGGHLRAAHEYDGAIFAFAGPLSGTRELDSADVVLHGADAWDRFGSSIAPVGDWNADGLPDLAVVSWPFHYPAVPDGVVFVTVDL